MRGTADMVKRKGRDAAIAIVTVSAAVIAALAAMTPTTAQAAGGRQAMERCVDRVLARLTHAGAAEPQVGPAILSECDGPLQAVLADAIESGEAPNFCKIALCLTLARSRAAEEATQEYRRRVRAAVHIAVAPPSRTNSAPVAKAASSDAR